LVDKKIAHGTGNIARGPAITHKQAVQTLLNGAAVVEAELEKGLDILETGDMGIGSTTPSAAIAATITGRMPAEIVGRNTGVDDAGLARKIAAVQSALAVNRPDPHDGAD